MHSSIQEKAFHKISPLALAGFILLALTLLFPGNLFANDIELRGMARSYTGVRFSEMDIPINEQTLDITLEGWGDSTRFIANPYAYIELDKTLEMGVREAFIEIFMESMDLRVGKQVVVWGEAEGAFITDIVSPRDLRSFILADFREIRKGVPAVKANYYTGPFTLEGVWIPRFVPTSPPAADSLWGVQPSFGDTPVQFAPNATMIDLGVDPTLANSEIFGKISYFGSSLNAQIMAGYAWDDEPVITQIVPSTEGITSITKEHERYTIIGGSLSSTIASAVVRTEAAIYLDRSFNAITMTPGGPVPSVEKHNQVHALVGLDWNLWGKTMSAQYFIQYIADHNEGLLAKELQQTITFRVQDTYFSDRLTLRLFGYLGLDPLDALIRPSLTWSIEDGVVVEAGAEIFLGSESGMFGKYSDNTLGYVSLRWYF